MLKKKGNSELLLKNYSLVNSFIIFGSPARKSNNRIFTGSSFILGKSAQKYINIFSKQIKKIKLKNIPYNDREYIWVFEMWYNNKLADASTELVFDIMQHHKIIDDDVSIRNCIVLSEELDYEVPRMKVSIYKNSLN